MKINRNIKNAGPYLGIVLLLHILGFGALFFSGWQHPILIGMGFIAYTLGLRHAFDADHIAAIDNTVRKLLEQKESPTGVGFYFSLGHSSVVFLMAVLLGVAVNWAKDHIATFQDTGGLIGTLVSGFFLIIIGVINLIILIQLIQLFKKVRTEHITSVQLNALLNSRGFMIHLVKPFFKFISKSWHVYPLGFLFGLGFDTASEVSFLALSAGAAQRTLPLIGIIALPILFAAGMSLLDTLDGVVMTEAYHWAFETPVRKIYYNITITSISVIAALFIGVLEILQLIGEQQHWTTGIGGWITQLDVGWLGYGLVIVFILAWLVSVTIWKVFKIENTPN
ncbi:HoxN/HupN/NixA family nickel/cobalt transporter [Staphylococcus agnetis]|uniref:HoxN/HupN/NixA family nickel/cobalt transporter n=1 Tax=Staphylococcus agnetis TaxID=985762 RepID=UPI00208EF4C8|nr:HoxN/HupN/NixA family nickel/cobalt transporter [Staphylococcus agnetis]MCO4346512.1 HoxN/HupN/NixA family nickel/cobalt transporter [Staphylococcus agnetis]MCO4347090.1 HoxN/HupN/NixA family nickel/cobalt transporter [Staphylococcus agnetis]MCO4349529.1 HoxN/HupN/NixA family nickel/cobalt transporter [Staphylococcus agnetis]MCO4353781.1 HoxN/HupN/NixA family nickel/cobalt transporter [Staphylococcus agnetis]MCO4356022.1 HoxN/HupN/NixA family nickel/cobalt transporter [Staphylococcus agneti